MVKKGRKKLESGSISISSNVGPGSAVGPGAKVEAENIAGRDVNKAGRDLFKSEGNMYIYQGVEPSKPKLEYEPPSIPNPDKLSDLGPLPPGSYLAHSHNPYFTGRETELLTLAKMLLHQVDGEDVIVTQTAVASGLGGIGKTQLAVEFAHRYGRYFAGGIYWLNCGNVTGIPAEVAVIGGKGRMGLYQDTDNLTLEEQVRLVKQAWQEPTPRLLILDNCDGDESLTAEAVLAKWRPVTGGCRMLVTSRSGQWAATLGVRQLPLDVLSRPESIELLRRFVPDLVDSDADAIAYELGDLPLALHLAGSYLKRYGQIVTPEKYLARLQDKKLLEHPSLQGRGEKYSPTGHELHVARTFALSYERLNPEDETDKVALALLARTACFAPGEALPVTLLLATLSNDEEDVDTALWEQDGLQRLESLGLLTYKKGNNCQLHRLLAVYVQDVMEVEIKAVWEQVVEEVAIRASEINWGGYPASLLVWQQHLHYVAERAIEQESTWAGRLMYELGHHLKIIGDYETAYSCYKRTLEIDEARLGKEHPDVAHTLNNLGMLLLTMGEYEGAKPYLRQALAIRKKILGLEHIDTARSLNNFGFLLHEMGDYEGAKPYYEQALEIRIEILGLVDADIANSLNNLGKLLYEMGDYEGARSYYEQALAIREKVLDPEHPQIAVSLNNLGVFLQETVKDYKASRSCFDRSLAIFKKAYGEDHPRIAETLNNLGVLLCRTGDFTQASLAFKRALAIFEQVLGATHPKAATLYKNLGEVLEVTGDYDGAQAAYEWALVIWERVLGVNHPNTQTVRQKLVTLKNGAGNDNDKKGDNNG